MGKRNQWKTFIPKNYFWNHSRDSGSDQLKNLTNNVQNQMWFFLILNKFCKFSGRLCCWAQKKIPFMWFEKLKQMCISSNGVKLSTSLEKFLQCCKILTNLNLFKKILAEHESEELSLHTDYYYPPLMCSFFPVCFLFIFFFSPNVEWRKLIYSFFFFENDFPKWTKLSILEAHCWNQKAVT